MIAATSGDHSTLEGFFFVNMKHILTTIAVSVAALVVYDKFVKGRV